MKTTIVDYIGKYGPGVLVKIGLIDGSKYYDAIFFYTENKMWITMDHDYVKENGPIQEHEEYLDILNDLINKVDPHEKIYEQLDEYQHKDIGDQS